MQMEPPFTPIDPLHAPGRTREMFTRHPREQHRSAALRAASAACAMITLLSTAGVTRPVAAADRIQPSHDRRVLSDIAQDVLRHRAGGDRSVGEPSLPGWTGLRSEPESSAADTEPDQSLATTHIAPGPGVITVPMAPRARSPKPIPEEGEPAGYHSNSWRQR